MKIWQLGITNDGLRIQENYYRMVEDIDDVVA